MVAQIVVVDVPPSEDRLAVRAQGRRDAAAFAGMIHQDLLARKALARVIGPADGDPAACESLPRLFRRSSVALVEPGRIKAAFRREEKNVEALPARIEKRRGRGECLAAVR